MPICLQISAASALKGKRSNWGSQRNWLGDYLSLSSENPDWEKYKTAVKIFQREEKFKKVSNYRPSSVLFLKLREKNYQ